MTQDERSAVIAWLSAWPAHRAAVMAGREGTPRDAGHASADAVTLALIHLRGWIDFQETAEDIRAQLAGVPTRRFTARQIGADEWGIWETDTAREGHGEELYCVAHTEARAVSTAAALNAQARQDTARTLERRTIEELRAPHMIY